MQFFINIFLLTFTLIITGCSSKKLTIKSLHPSKIEKEKIHTITIQRFYRDDVEQTTSIINKIANKTVDNKKIFTIKNTNSEVDAILAGDVLNSSINVYEYFRTQTDYSRCRFYRYDDKNKTKECIEYRIINIPCEKREYNVKTNVILTKPITNDIIFSKTYDKSNFEDICFDHHTYRTFPDKYKINSLIADDIASDILDDISPHYVYYDIEIIDELDDSTIVFTKEQEIRFEKAVEFILSRNLDLAKNELEKLNNEFSGKSFEVLYNLALVNEAFNQLLIANELYVKARSLTFDIKYLDLVNFGIGRTHDNLEARNKAKAQLQQ